MAVYIAPPPLLCYTLNHLKKWEFQTAALDFSLQTLLTRKLFFEPYSFPNVLVSNLGSLYVIL